MSEQLIDAAIAELPADVAQETADATPETPSLKEGEAAKTADPLDPAKLAKRVSRQDRKIGQLTAIKHQTSTENAQLKAEIERLTKIAGPAIKDDGRPKESDYNSVIDYMRADAEWIADQRVSRFEKTQQETQAKTQQAAVAQSSTAQRDAELDTQAAEFFKSTADGQEIIGKARDIVAALPDSIKDVLRRSANPTLAIYNLAKEDGLEDLADMHPIDAAITIHEAQKAVPTRQTKAPAPMASASGRSGSRAVENMDAAELMKWAGIR